MPVFTSGTTISGTNGAVADDYIFAVTNGDTNINAGDGDDVVYGDSNPIKIDFFTSASQAAFSPITNILDDRWKFIWNRAENPDVTNSTTVSYAQFAIDGTMAGNQGWLAVTVVAGATITLDVDYGLNATGNATDTQLQIFGSNGTTSLAFNDDVPSGTPLDNGSLAREDSLLTYTFGAAGTYLINIREFNNGDGTGSNFEANDNFILNISLTGQNRNDTNVAGNDTISGGLGNDVLWGQNGNDILSGDIGKDTLRGGSGNDTFNYRLGALAAGEIIDGGADIDKISYNGSISYIFDLRIAQLTSIEQLAFGSIDESNTARVQVNASQFGSGLSSLLALFGNSSSGVIDAFQVFMNGVTSLDLRGLQFTNFNQPNDVVSVSGGDLAETINGSSVDDSIRGGGGSDFLYGENGIDFLYGDAGSDTLNGGGGGDTIWGGVGFGDQLDSADMIYGNAGDDFLYGNSGDDFIYGGGDLDRIDGGSGNDTIFGEAGADTLFGGRGNDTIWGGVGFGDQLDSADMIYGNAGNDFLYGNSGDDFIYGGDDLDRIDGGSGNDSIFGEAGVDTLFGGRGTDTINGGTGSDILYGNADADRFVFSDALNAGTNVDAIMDFVSGTDKIALSQTIFGSLALTPGFAATELQLGTSSTSADSNNYIIYNQSTGQLFYDADANGALSQAVLFATVTAGMTLAFGDFVLVA